MVKYINSSGMESEVLMEFLKIEAAEKKKLEDAYDLEPSEDVTGTELIEKAHPESGEVLKSYHVDGGVVENEATQQKADIEVADKMPTGYKVSRKQTIPNKKDLEAKAENELLNELKIIAEEMSVRGQNDLVKFSNNVSQNIKKNSSFQKEAAFPFLAVGITAAAIILPTIGAWWYSTHSTDDKNTGISNNINQLQAHLNLYVEAFQSEQTGEELGSVADRLNELAEFINKLKLSRDAYIKEQTDLAQELQQITNIKPGQTPTAKNIIDNVDQTIKDQPKLKANSKIIIDTINSKNKRYSTYITNTILPKLKEDLKYFSTYFRMTKSIAPVKEKSGIWNSITELFSSKPEMKNEGAKIIEFLSRLIESLDADVQLRGLEAQHAIESLSKKIEVDISKEFAPKPSAEGKNVGYAAQKTEDMSLKE